MSHGKRRVTFLPGACNYTIRLILRQSPPSACLHPQGPPGEQRQFPGPSWATRWLPKSSCPLGVPLQKSRKKKSESSEKGLTKTGEHYWPLRQDHRKWLKKIRLFSHQTEHTEDKTDVRAEFHSLRCCRFPGVEQRAAHSAPPSLRAELRRINRRISRKL